MKPWSQNGTYLLNFFCLSLFQSQWKKRDIKMLLYCPKLDKAGLVDSRPSTNYFIPICLNKKSNWHMTSSCYLKFIDHKSCFPWRPSFDNILNILKRHLTIFFFRFPFSCIWRLFTVPIICLISLFCLSYEMICISIFYCFSVLVMQCNTNGRINETKFSL